MACGVIVGTYFRTQIIDHSRYELQSRNNRLRPIIQPAPRGIITDRHGIVIAENVPGYTVALLPATDSLMRARLQHIAPILHLDAAAIERVLQRYRKAPYQSAVVMTDAPFDVVSTLEERRLTLPGVVIQTEPKRYYPDSAAVAHVIGMVGEVTEQDLAGPRGVPLRLGELVGKDGLERSYDDTLRGQDGEKFVEVSALAYVVREGAAPDLRPVAGAKLQTTLDL